MSKAMTYSGESEGSGLKSAQDAAAADQRATADQLQARSGDVVQDAGSHLLRQHEIAVVLGVNDKRVATWRARADKNGFPEPSACNFGPTYAGGKRRHMLWDSREVLEWFRGYDVRAQRARGGTSQKGRHYNRDGTYTQEKTA